MTLPCRFALALFAVFALTFAASANNTPPQVKGSGLPVPRFVTLKAEEVYLRTGPGTIYPIEWVFVRKGMPVEVIAEFDTWRRIRDWEGAEGWVHQTLLSGRRAVVITGDIRPLRKKPEFNSVTVARMEPGVIAHLERCENAWCHIEASDYDGWVRRDEIWGVYPDEVVE